MVRHGHGTNAKQRNVPEDMTGPSKFASPKTLMQLLNNHVPSLFTREIDEEPSHLVVH